LIYQNLIRIEDFQYHHKVHKEKKKKTLDLIFIFTLYISIWFTFYYNEKIKNPSFDTFLNIYT